jgi:hypothetical protein
MIPCLVGYLNHIFSCFSMDSQGAELEAGRGLDLTKIFKMLKEQGISSTSSKDDDVVLLMGNTGSGKSLTINYLSGKKVHFLKTPIGNEVGEEMEYDEMLEVEDPLPGCEVGHSGDSKTRYPQKYRDSATQLLYFDTPGFEDTVGCHIDVVNAIAISTILSSCKSFRLVLVIQESTIGTTRGTELKKLCRLIHRFIPSTMDSMASVLPLITHSQSVSHKKMQARLEKLMDTTHFSDAKPLLVRMISLLKEHKEHMLLSPAGEIGASRLPHVIRLVESLTPLVAKENALQSSLGEKAVKEIVIAYYEFMLDMQRRINFGDGIDTFEDSMNDCKMLSDLLGDSEITERYNNLVAVLANHISSLCSKAHGAFLAENLLDARKYLEQLDGFETLAPHYSARNPDLKQQAYAPVIACINAAVATARAEINDLDTTYSTQDLQVRLAFLEQVEEHLRLVLDPAHHNCHASARSIVTVREQHRKTEVTVDSLRLEIDRLNSQMASATAGMVEAAMRTYREESARRRKGRRACYECSECDKCFYVDCYCESAAAYKACQQHESMKHGLNRSY